MAEVKMRLNLNTVEVELVVDGQVALTSGPDVFKSWVDAYNKLNPPEPVVVEVEVPAAVEEEAPSETPTEETDSEEAVDSPEQV